MGQPRPLFVFLVFSTKNFTENNCRCQRDLNSDHGSRKMSMLTTWPPPPRPEFVVVLSSLMYFYFQVYLTTFQLLHLLWLIINLEAKASGNSTVSWSYTFSIIKTKPNNIFAKLWWRWCEIILLAILAIWVWFASVGNIQVSLHYRAKTWWYHLHDLPYNVQLIAFVRVEVFKVDLYQFQSNKIMLDTSWGQWYCK